MADADRAQLAREVAHWQLAIESLGDLESVASPSGWASLETYLETGLRGRLAAMVDDLRESGRAVHRLLDSATATEMVRAELLRLRGRYLQAETILDFYGDAIATRGNPAMGALMRGYDVLAADSMAASLRPLGLASPPALVYLDKGLGAAILRAGVRLWNESHPSPAAAIKLTRHNLLTPTSLLHETGHQVAHQTGWNGELARALHAGLQHHSPALASVWAGWAREVAADVHAFVQAGFAPVAALANVVDGSSRSVYFVRPADPHPFAMVRVLFNVAMCRSWYGSGPWDELASTWLRRHPPTSTNRGSAITASSMAAMEDIVDICTRTPMRAFGARAISKVLDPMLVSPAGLADFERIAGSSLTTSTYLGRREPLRILAVLVNRGMNDPTSVAGHRQSLQQWVTSLGDDAHPNRQTHPTNRAA